MLHSKALSAVLMGLFFAAGALLPVQAQAIDIPADLRRKLLGGDGKSSPEGLGQEALDNTVDPDRYIIGGGDGFEIAIVGLPSMEFFPSVDADGNLYDGELGLIPVGGLTLAKAKVAVADKVRRSLRKDHQVYVALRKMKSVSVTVVGAVKNPGTHTVRGNTRVLDVVKLANGGQLPPPATLDLRQVRVRNGDSARVYDILRFLTRQDVDHNPYVNPGDIVGIDPVDSRVYVTGEVREPMTGWLPILPGETVGDLMEILSPKSTADLDAILVQPAGGTGAGKPAPLAEVRAIKLGHNDVINIGAAEIRRRADTVKVSGEVRRPGTYAVQPGKVAAEDLVRMAGGVSDQGDPARLFVLRHRRRDALFGPPPRPDPNSPLPPQVLRHPVPALAAVRPEVGSSVNDLAVSADYIVLHPSATGGRVDLEDGDELHVPRRERYVYVSGNVMRPGAYPYRQGAGYEHYVDLAGGYGSKADPPNRYVLASYNGITQLKDVDAIAAGDVLVIPTAIEYKRYTSIWLPILQIIPGILSLFVTVFVVAQQ